MCLGQACAEKFGTEDYLKIDTCVIVWTYASTLYCSRNYVSPELHVCVQGDPDCSWLFSILYNYQVYLVSGNRCCHAELKMVKNITLLSFGGYIQASFYSQAADWPGRDLPVPSRNCT